MSLNGRPSDHSSIGSEGAPLSSSGIISMCPVARQIPIRSRLSRSAMSMRLPQVGPPQKQLIKDVIMLTAATESPTACRELDSYEPLRSDKPRPRAVQVENAIVLPARPPTSMPGALDKSPPTSARRLRIGGCIQADSRMPVDCSAADGERCQHILPLSKYRLHGTNHRPAYFAKRLMKTSYTRMPKDLRFWVRASGF